MSQTQASIIASSSITASSTSQPYPVSLSRWHASKQDKKLRVVFSFYSPDGNEVSIPIASISAYLKREFGNIEILLAPILIGRYPDRFSPQQYAQLIGKLSPDVIAFSLMSPHWYSTEPYLEAIKQVIPDLAIVIGGYQAMLSQQETISNPDVDFICVGDGEWAMANLLRHLQGTADTGVDGMWEKLSDGSLFKTDPHQIEDLQALPFPDYDLFARHDGYQSVISSIFGPKGKIVLPVMTGRGCPYRCTYCCNTPLLEDWKNKKTFLRKYDAEALVDELARLKEKFNVGYFEFWDELFLSNLKFVKAFFALYKEKIKLPFSINSRVEIMNQDFCDMAADAGCHTIWFGIESGDEAYRSRMLGRKMTNEQVIEAADNCKRAGIYRLTFNIVGMPLETADNMRATLELNRRIAPEHFYFFPYVPLRGTPLYETAEQEGLLLPLKENIHYLSAANDRKFELNLKERPDLLSQQQYAQICHDMLRFQQQNNRLSYVTGNQMDTLPANEGVESNRKGKYLSNANLEYSQQLPMSNTQTDRNRLSTLTGEHIVLEKLSPTHAEYIHSIDKDDGFWSAYRRNQVRNLSLAEIRTRLDQASRIPAEQLGKIEWIINKRNGSDLEAIGLAALAALDVSQGRAEFLVGIVNPEDRTTGTGLEATLLVFDHAFNTLKLNKLSSFIYSDDPGSRESTLALGFQQEGLLRQHMRPGDGGNFVDVMQFGLLAEEFFSSKRLSRLSRRLLKKDITQPRHAQAALQDTPPAEQENASAHELAVSFEIQY